MTPHALMSTSNDKVSSTPFSMVSQAWIWDKKGTRKIISYL